MTDTWKNGGVKVVEEEPLEVCVRGRDDCAERWNFVQPEKFRRRGREDRHKSDYPLQK